MPHFPVSVNLDALIGQFRNYKNPSRILADLNQIGCTHSALVPKRGKLTLNTGQECELLMLEGTIPTNYRGNTYNTPVEIYITENYPASPPMCYIRPTSGMSLKKGHRHVDQSGLVYHPYLHSWSERTHNLVQLCTEMSSTFGAEPPLYASKAARPAPSPFRPGELDHQNQNQNPYTNRKQNQDSSRQPYVLSSSPQAPAYQPRSPPLPPRPNVAEIRKEKEQALTRKLQGELQMMYNDLRSEIDAEFEKQEKLKERARLMDINLEELSRRKTEFERLTKLTTQRCDELDEYLEELKNQGEPEVEDLIEPKDALSQQMLRLVAENAALEDALYYLDQGVTEGALDIDAFLREVRRLSRKQFMARATMKKVERAQEETRAAKARFDAQQTRRLDGGGRYPHLPERDSNTGGRHEGGPPPAYTPVAPVGLGRYWNPTGGSEGHRGYQGYQGYQASQGSQASHTQRR